MIVENSIKILLNLNHEQSKGFACFNIYYIKNFYFRSYNISKRILTMDLFAILASLKMKGLFYKKVVKDNDDENYNIKSKARRGLISN